MTSGLGCDGDTVAMTAATQPSLEDLLHRALPGMPGVALYNPFLAVENGEDFMQAWYDAEAGRLDPFILVLEGAVPNERDQRRRALGRARHRPASPASRSPPTSGSTGWRRGRRSCWRWAPAPTYGGIPAMRNNPTGAMGLRDHLGHGWRSRLGHPIVNLPGCPAQPDNITETLLYLVLQLAGTTAPIDLDEQGRPAWLFQRTAHEVCNRAGFAEPERLRRRAGRRLALPRQVRLQGPGRQVQRARRAGGSTGSAAARTSAASAWRARCRASPTSTCRCSTRASKGKAIAAASRFAYGPLLKQLRNQSMKRRYEIEPEWRRPGATLASGYEPRW